jgi:mono/diheme cytochrome c family protein
VATIVVALAAMLSHRPALGVDAATFSDIYAARCASCHGMDGSSDTPSGRALKVSPLLNDDRIAGMTPAEIVRHIRDNPKHGAVIDFTTISNAELLAAAEYVRRLCAGR